MYHPIFTSAYKDHTRYTIPVTESFMYHLIPYALILSIYYHIYTICTIYHVRYIPHHVICRYVSTLVLIIFLFLQETKEISSLDENNFLEVLFEIRSNWGHPSDVGLTEVSEISHQQNNNQIIRPAQAPTLLTQFYSVLVRFSFLTKMVCK